MPTFLEDFVRQKNCEFKGRTGIAVEYGSSDSSNNFFIKLGSIELKSILSNLVNNAADSYGGNSGLIEIDLFGAANDCRIEIKDSGAGIPGEYLNDLGVKRITFKGSSCRGVGLVHAYKVVESWGGKIEIKSRIGEGTKVIVVVPRYVDKKNVEFESGPIAKL